MSLEGRHLGRYRLLEPLGSGGMSVVYKGLDTSLQREVAIKVLHPHLARQQDARARLAREARAVARLQHPNILEVFDFADPTSEEAFLVTELVRGETLKTFALKEALWPPEIAAIVVQQLAHALSHAHDAGVIHRDLKPENVMVRDDGVLKLMDFGIARVLDPGDRMTLTGALVGSPAYMAPEVINGEPATPESDVFSLGTLLYWLWTGALPFAASNTHGVLKRILDGTYDDPRLVCPAISDDLVGIFSRCLARDPGERFASGHGLASALSTYLEELDFTDAAGVLTAFFADPEGGRKLAVDRLLTSLLARADDDAGHGRIPRALSRLNQLLALEPDDPRVRALVERLEASQRRALTARRARRIGLGALGVLVATGAVVALGRIPLRAALRASAAPLPAAPAEVAVASGLPSSSPAARELPSGQPPSEVGPVAGVRASRIGAARSVAPPERASVPRASPVQIQVLVRPYGSVQVDDGRRSAEALSVHTLSLLPGHHLLRVSCQWCEDQVVPVDVLAGNPQTLAVPARLRPAQLRFAFEPQDARVRVGEVSRSAEESLAQPFDIPSPRAPTRFLHRVEYEVSRPGYRTVRSAVDVLPGATRTLSGKLVAE